MPKLQYPIPLYFNYVGALPDLLEAAVASVKHTKVRVIVNTESQPIPFTKCLNKILRDVGDEPHFMFMHYDAEIVDQGIFDKLFELYEKAPEKVCSVTSTNITDLLVLYNTQKIRKLGGWDEGFSNSFMELDLRKRIGENNMLQLILYPDSPDAPQINHKNASSLRNNEVQGNIASVYDETFTKDIVRFYDKYPNEKKTQVYYDFVFKLKKFSNSSLNNINVNETVKLEEKLWRNDNGCDKIRRFLP